MSNDPRPGARRCLSCDRAARHESSFCADCARSFELENWYQREFQDGVHDAFAYAHPDNPEINTFVRRDFTVKEIRSYARELRADQRKRGI